MTGDNYEKKTISQKRGRLSTAAATASGAGAGEVSRFYAVILSPRIAARWWRGHVIFAASGRKLAAEEDSDSWFVLVNRSFVFEVIFYKSGELWF